MSAALPLDIGSRFFNWSGQHLRRRRFQVTDRPDTQGQVETIVKQPLRGPFGETIGPRTKRCQRLSPWSDPSSRRPVWPIGNGDGPTDCTGQTMHLIFRHHRADRRNLRHLMTMRSRVFTSQLMLAGRTLARFERDDLIDLLDREQLSRLTSMPRLTAGGASAGLTTTCATLSRWPIT